MITWKVCIYKFLYRLWKNVPNFTLNDWNFCPSVKEWVKYSLWPRVFLIGSAWLSSLTGYFRSTQRRLTSDLLLGSIIKVYTNGCDEISKAAKVRIYNLRSKYRSRSRTSISLTFNRTPSLFSNPHPTVQSRHQGIRACVSVHVPSPSEHFTAHRGRQTTSSSSSLWIVLEYPIRPFNCEEGKKNLQKQLQTHELANLYNF